MARLSAGLPAVGRREPVDCRRHAELRGPARGSRGAAYHDRLQSAHGRDQDRKPDLSFPIRALGNVTYSDKKGYFEIGRQKKVRTLTVNTVKSFAQTLRMMGLSKEARREQRFRHQAGRLLPVEELGRRDVHRPDRVGCGHG